MRFVRLVPALVLGSALVACGGSGGGGGDDDTTPDAPDNPPPARGFQIVTPDIDIQPGQEITYCYYFRTPNTETLAIKSWSSNMTPGSHHMIMFMTTSDVMPPGTVSASGCGLGQNAQNIPIWTYAAQTPDATIALPTDDGTGKPLAQEVPANSPAFFQMHYLNATDQVIKAHVTLNAFALDAGVTFTKTAAYVTYNGNISIPNNVTDFPQSMTCDVPTGTKFWLMSTHAHKQAVHTAVKDGTNVVFESTDWEHPGAATFMTPDTFYSFTSNKLTYECRYTNMTGRTITSGDSAATDEMCMASGYYFPATKPRFCYNNFLVP
ncbi:MAG TPA: hypothetical protein VFQ53_15595 [Kofleriaceae bacterium]|nr:hypothetical protein [Kofleriaceae bacterium]